MAETKTRFEPNAADRDQAYRFNERALQAYVSWHRHVMHANAAGVIAVLSMIGAQLQGTIPWYLFATLVSLLVALTCSWMAPALDGIADRRAGERCMTEGLKAAPGWWERNGGRLASHCRMLAQGLLVGGVIGGLSEIYRHTEEPPAWLPF